MSSKTKTEGNHTNVAVQLYEYDSFIGFWGARNREKLVYGQYRDEPIHVYHNSDGLRDDEHLEIGTQGSVVVIGGSHTWGGGIDKEARYSDRLTSGSASCKYGSSQFGIRPSLSGFVQKIVKI